MQELVNVDLEGAEKTLQAIDSTIESIKSSIKDAEGNFVDLAFLLIEAKTGAFWALRGFKNEHDWIERFFPQSRAQYYALIKVARELSQYDRKFLRSIGRSKCEDLTRIHRSNQDFRPDEEWAQHALSDDKDTFRRRVRGYLEAKDGKSGDDPGDPKVEDSFISFRIFGGAITTVDMAFNTLAKIAGTDKSKSNLFILMCANFNSQFAEDGTGHVVGKNSYILGTIKDLIKQLDLGDPMTSQRLVGIVRSGIEENCGTPVEEEDDQQEPED